MLLCVCCVSVRYAAGVDLVLSGHVHAFERTHPLYKYRRARARRGRSSSLRPPSLEISNAQSCPLTMSVRSNIIALRRKSVPLLAPPGACVVDLSCAFVAAPPCSALSAPYPLRRVDTCGPMYLTIGDGGNIEGPYRRARILLL